MKPKQSLEWIKDFESKSNNLNYNIDGVDCWPVIRNTLLAMVLPKSGHGASASLNLSSGSIINITKSLKDILLLKKADVFILSDEKFSEKISSSTYLKDAHVLAEKAKLESKVPIIALQNLSIKNNIVGREYCRSVFFVLLFAAGVAKLSIMMQFIPKFSRYTEEIIKELANAPMLTGNTVTYKALRKQVYRNILFCLVAKKIFSLILRKVKPEEVYVICYYSVLGMALCSACRQLNIPITDIQHGVAGASMRAYAGWQKVPKQGYTTLPDTFFCWTNYDEDAINLWAKKTMHHKAVLTGNLWHDYIMDNSLLVTSESQWSSFFDLINIYKKTVLITMQSSNLPKLFVDVIKQSSSATCFLIRMHPGFLLNKNEDYRDLDILYPNVFFEQPSVIPIQVLMKHVDVHLTEWSGAVMDAYFAGVRSIVVSENALDYFDKYFKDGVIDYASSHQGVIDMI